MTIEDDIRAIDPDALEWLEEQDAEFMRPYAAYFDRHEWEGGPIDGDREDSECAGWYAHLSAPGYLDCTEWHGPYQSEAEALVELYRTYGD